MGESAGGRPGDAGQEEDGHQDHSRGARPSSALLLSSLELSDTNVYEP